MSKFLVIGLLVVGFAAVVGGMLVLMARGAAQWRRKMDDLLLPIGFEHCDDDAEKAALAQRLGIVNPRHQGKRALARLYQRRLADGATRLFVGDYHFGSAGGRTSGGTWLIVALVAPGAAWPRLSITAVPRVPALLGRLASTLDRQLAIPGLRRVQTGQAALDARLLVHAGQDGPPPAQLLKVLDRLQRCGAEPSLDCGGDTLVLTSVSMLAERVRQQLDGQKLLALIHLAQPIQEALQAGQPPDPAPSGPATP
ncbi:MAG: hypothetical protein JNM97_15455 [Rhodoferax sp.]|jgi:hypothetical protein|nr:hypothetical protein [Rhodoferax sp.]